ncbi:hypothetical protein ALC57_09024 [Trachymyrmex cornetzi]|uniref:DUF8207 domain-containing protein n=1 Tax=Trachymyrmex cornetzi TaxID=471704 RepID=A0A151J632_9HYME|nr:hypothetical protein ALC57_09024 [Trachymyrmex cornetzi]
MEDVREREKIARENEKTSESIRKKHRALKTGRIEEDMALKRRFKPIIKPLRQIVDSPGMRATKRQSRDNDAASAPKREKEEAEEKEGEEASETIPDDALYTEDDMNKYKSMLLATNAHKHKHHSQIRLLSNRGYKYKHIIAPLMSMTPKKQSKKSGKGLPRAMTLNDNAIDYVHWNDPNELVYRLRLLDASHRAENNAHDNEMLSIIEELREAGLIIN